MAKIIILNQATIFHNYSQIDALSRTTWGLYKHPDVKCIHYYGAYDIDDRPVTGFPYIPAKGEVAMFDDDRMLVGTNDTHGPYFDPRGEKMMLAYEYCLKHFDFDFILRICNTSYIDIEAMVKYFNSIRKERIYDGTRNLYNNEISFVTGFNSYLSRDTVEKVVEHKQDYLDIKLPEDLALGKLIMHDLKYTNFEDQPQIDIHVLATEPGFKPDSFVGSERFNYRFRSHTVDEYVAFHNYMVKRYQKD
jgi:hypothetical protein